MSSMAPIFIPILPIALLISVPTSFVVYKLSRISF
jgi:hypothetical protein